MLYNIARCEEELHQNQAAIETYQRYTAVSTSAVEREELAQRIERLRRESAVTAPAPAVLVRAPAPPPRARPIYRRWWLWTIVGGVAAASLAVGLGVGLGTSSSPSAPAFPPLTVQPTR
ncbi:MAG TPA: hypothetical protein VFF06_37265, partial [Polyangia bacterium]|nr:hypothetical protein [Polyangia bacterium]